jgi:hypothetical protein
MAASHHIWHALDERAVAFAREQLSAGKGLARACEPLLADVRPKAYLPAAMPAERIYAFRTGGINCADSSDEALPAEALWGFLRSPGGGQRLLVFEDPYARPTDGFITSGRAYTAVAFHGEDVYQIIPVEAAGDALQLPVTEYPLIGVATTTERPGGVANGDRLDGDLLEELARNSVAILVGAWDAENYLVLDRGLIDAAVTGRD